MMVDPRKLENLSWKLCMKSLEKELSKSATTNPNSDEDRKTRAY